MSALRVLKPNNAHSSTHPLPSNCCYIVCEHISEIIEQQDSIKISEESIKKFFTNGRCSLLGSDESTSSKIFTLI